MVSAPIFADNFYLSSLFAKGERAYVTPDNTLALSSKETLCNRVKRFFSYEQDPYIDQVHNRLAEISQQIAKKSGPLYSRLVKEAHDKGQIGLEHLEENVSRLREKLDKVGQLNYFSQLTLKVVNFFRVFFGWAPIAIKTYATITYEEANPIWAGNIAPGLDRCVNSSFSINILSLKKAALSVTEEDRRSCRFSAESPNEIANEAIQKLQRGLLKIWHLRQIVKSYDSVDAEGRVLMGTEQVLGNLEVTFNKQRQVFSFAIRNPRSNEAISSRFEQFLENTPLVERTISYRVQIKNAQGHIENEELIWHINASRFHHHLNPPTQESLILELGKEYSFFDGAEPLATFTLRANPLCPES